jgi:glycosyltransferase involved in cell wall biosynthesis
MDPDRPAASIAVLLPCYNEALTIAKVVADFRAALPEATIYVYDNNSSDDTAKIAREAGAEVRFEKRQGKGFVIASMLAEVVADYYPRTPRMGSQGRRPRSHRFSERAHDPSTTHPANPPTRPDAHRVVDRQRDPADVGAGAHDGDRGGSGVRHRGAETPPRLHGRR